MFENQVKVDRVIRARRQNALNLETTGFSTALVYMHIKDFIHMFNSNQIFT